ncbi:MAG: hypothetical protein ACYDGR_06325 [Candidatus Dormibacteria bacterium]
MGISGSRLGAGGMLLVALIVAGQLSGIAAPRWANSSTVTSPPVAPSRQAPRAAVLVPVQGLAPREPAPPRWLRSALSSPLPAPAASHARASDASQPDQSCTAGSDRGYYAARLIQTFTPSAGIPTRVDALVLFFDQYASDIRARLLYFPGAVEAHGTSFDGLELATAKVGVRSERGDQQWLSFTFTAAGAASSAPALGNGSYGVEIDGDGSNFGWVWCTDNYTAGGAYVGANTGTPLSPKLRLGDPYDFAFRTYP